MTLDHFYCCVRHLEHRCSDVEKGIDFYYWKNPFWGTPEETMAKIKEFYGPDNEDYTLLHAPPVPGAREGVQALKDMGYKVIKPRL